MANLWITEFDALPQAPLCKIPTVASQVVAFAASTQSVAINAGANFVRVVADANCHIEAGANPTATTDSLRLTADSVEYFAVTPGHKIAAITA